MKYSIVSIISLLAAGAHSFVPQSTTSAKFTQLNLFGGGNKSDANKGPGMMDQLAMFKKAAEVAQKKKQLDEELAAESFQGSGADGKVTATCKILPSKNPMDPQPEYEAVAFEFDDEWYEGASPEELSTAVKEAISDGIAKTSIAAMEKYKVLEELFRA